jgi:hypothetical protein
MPPSKDRAQKVRFGQTVCMSADGRRMVVGANGFQNFRGLAYVFDLVSGSGDRPQNWRRTKLVAKDARSAEEKPSGELRVADRGSGFGFSCAMDATGDTILIGAPGHDVQRGIVYVFSRSADKRKWVETDSLNGPEQRIGDYFGWAITASQDGRTVVISAKGRRANNGEVYAYDCREGSFSSCELGQQIKPPDYTDEIGPRGIRIRNNFGSSLVMSGKSNLLAIASTGYMMERGAVYVFKMNPGSRLWHLSQKVKSPNPVKHAFFGYKLAMDFEGATLAIGADGEDDYRGSVYVFHRFLNGSTEGESVIACASCDSSQGLFGSPTRLVANEREAEDNYGGSLAVSSGGDILAVGSPGKKQNSEADHGAVFVYKKHVKTVWNGSEVSDWDRIGVETLEAPHSQAGSYFAWAIALSSNGHRLISTAPEAYSSCGVVAVGRISHPQSQTSKTLRYHPPLSRVLKYFMRDGASLPTVHDDL